jgi:hypothetical protein
MFARWAFDDSVEDCSLVLAVPCWKLVYSYQNFNSILFEAIKLAEHNSAIKQSIPMVLPRGVINPGAPDKFETHTW